MKIFSKFKRNFMNKFLEFYENWIIPPQNESLIMAKRKEFKEKTKYLNPELLYSLSEEEKAELRSLGYFVDLNKDTKFKVQNFTISTDRHSGKYKFIDNNYNNYIYGTQYYYVDQEMNVFAGDEFYLNKSHRKRSKPKKYIYIWSFIFCYIWYVSYMVKKNTLLNRKKGLEAIERNRSMNKILDINTKIKGINPETKEFIEVDLVSLLNPNILINIITRIDDEMKLEIFLDNLSKIGIGVFKNLNIYFLLSKEFIDTRLPRFLQRNKEKYSNIEKSFNFFIYEYSSEELNEENMTYYNNNDFVIANANKEILYSTNLSHELSFARLNKTLTDSVTSETMKKKKN